ncbi:3-keto-disaccharide hydrolase [Mariniradius sediminis]|uniref:DUF1080 domain-containing protein n=1 Tax=Mariniradius sediminis TaxID=2909237 RepID=A0ABS9BX81_9BACT|nr:DUF1080 domain-containing protein [Mariniradius sediminis]MCF1752309.1 DUF1080 domain-containing protein [Mariniradius sediminis]
MKCTPSHRLLLLLTILLLQACGKKAEGPNSLSKAEKNEGWELLFDGETTNGWHVYNKGKLASIWQVKDGELYSNPENMSLETGDLVSDRQFEDFELKFEWKMTKGGNSGVFINVLEREDIPTPWASGPEYQLLENSHQDYTNDVKRPGCLYGFDAQKNRIESLPFGQWNQSRIRQVDGKIEFYLNGVLTAEKDLTSAEWQASVAESNFKGFPEFGKRISGHIVLQDWAKGVAFRNIKVKVL